MWKSSRIFLKADVQYLEKLNELHKVLPFLQERMKIERVENIVANLHDKIQHVIHMRKLNQTLNHGLFFKKVHKGVKFKCLVKIKKQKT